MGYDIHITRKQDWSDEDDSNEIRLTEWMDYVQSDSEMKLDNYAETVNDMGKKIGHESQGIAIWTSYSKHELDDNFAWFNFSNGNVTVKNADAEIKNKMIDIAGRLMLKCRETMEKFTTRRKSSNSNDLGGKCGEKLTNANKDINHFAFKQANVLYQF